MDYETDGEVDPWKHALDRVVMRLNQAGRISSKPRFVHRFRRVRAHYQLLYQRHYDGLIYTLETNMLRARHQGDKTVELRIAALIEFIAGKNVADAGDRQKIRDYLNDLNNSSPPQ